MTSALPIDAVLPELMEALAQTCRAAIETSPPGAGKPTRMPLALSDASWCGDGTVLAPEPRYLARAAARRRASGR